MGREVRRVPANWQQDQPLYPAERYPVRLAGWERAAAEFEADPVLQEEYGTVEYYAGNKPDRADYMPDFEPHEATHLMMFETCTDGLPISPAFRTPEELAQWLVDNNASFFGPITATYEQWLTIARGGYGGGILVSAGECAPLVVEGDK